MLLAHPPSQSRLFHRTGLVRPLMIGFIGQRRLEIDLVFSDLHDIDGKLIKIYCGHANEPYSMG